MKCVDHRWVPATATTPGKEKPPPSASCMDNGMCCPKGYTCMFPRGSSTKRCVGPTDGIKAPIVCPKDSATHLNHATKFATKYEKDRESLDFKGPVSVASAWLVGTAAVGGFAVFARHVRSATSLVAWEEVDDTEDALVE